MSQFKPFAVNLFLAAYLLVVSAPVSASVLGFTDILTSAEPSVTSVIENQYANAGYTRIHDFTYDSTVGNTDVEWNFLGGSSTPSFNILGKYAGYKSQFGIIYQELFWSLDAFIDEFGLDSSIKFHLGIVVSNNKKELYRWSSNSAQNSDGLDHMVTWLIDEELGKYAVAFEDLPGGGDHDFNDLILELRGFVDGPTAVPEPAMVALFGMGLAGFGWRRIAK